MSRLTLKVCQHCNTVLALHCAQVEPVPSRSLQPVQRARRTPSLFSRLEGPPPCLACLKGPQPVQRARRTPSPSGSPAACPGTARLAFLGRGKEGLGERGAAISAPSSQHCHSTAATATARPTSCTYQPRCRKIGWGRRMPGEPGRAEKAAVPSALVSSAIPRRVQRGPKRRAKSKRGALPSASPVGDGASRMHACMPFGNDHQSGSSSSLHRLREFARRKCMRLEIQLVEWSHKPL